MEQENFQDLPTPSLILDVDKLDKNIARLRDRVVKNGWSFRPHAKTSKSVPVMNRCFGSESVGPITVSTLREAEHFANAGFQDILYAVSIVPAKLPRVIKLRKSGVNLQVILDDAGVASQTAEMASESGAQLSVWIEIDCDGHRAGIPMDRKKELLALAKQIEYSDHLTVAGILTHAGESYVCQNTDQIREAAISEQDCLVTVADTLEREQIRCVGRSLGSSPTGLFGPRNESITELRAGVFMFQDLFQSNLGVCKKQDIALTVLTTVISHRRDRNWLIVDAGGLALSKDRGTASQCKDFGFGVVCDLDGRPLDGCLVTAANQEHGVISCGAEAIDFESHPIGSRLRILPNHACMTAAAHDGYHVYLDGQWKFWERVNGW